MRRVGRTQLVKELASGGMGTVFLGRRDDDGAWVAVKKPHDAFLHDPSSRDMFLREARIAALIQHPNVVRTLEVVATDAGELFYVMEYVDGESLSRIDRLASTRGIAMPPGVATQILLDILAGLHAAHEARGPDGASLGIVHRDISPQNVLVGLDGVARITDFGVAKTATHHTATGRGLKGKVGYVAPEQIHGGTITRAADIYAACVVGWELYAGEPLFQGASEAAILARVLAGRIRPLARRADPIAARHVEPLLLHGLAAKEELRPRTARELAESIARTGIAAGHEEVARFVAEVAGEDIRKRGVEPTETRTVTVAAGSERTLVLATPPPPVAVPREPPRAARRVVALLVGLLFSLTIMLAVGLGRRAGDASARGRDLFEDVDTAPPPLPVASRAASVASAETETPEPEGSPSLTPAAAAPPRPRAGEKKPATRRKSDCDVPYYVDESGIRRIRKECL